MRPRKVEITALGAAIVAAVGVGLTSAERVCQNEASVQVKSTETIFKRAKDTDWDEKFQKWRMAIEKSLNWDSSKL